MIGLKIGNICADILESFFHVLMNCMIWIHLNKIEIGCEWLKNRLLLPNEYVLFDSNLPELFLDVQLWKQNKK